MIEITVQTTHASQGIPETLGTKTTTLRSCDSAAHFERRYIATIELDAAGQAFAFDRTAERVVCAIDRPTRTVRRFTLPTVALDPGAGRAFAR